MKRIWIGLALTAVLITAGLWSSHAAQRHHLEVSRQLKTAGELVFRGDWTGGIAQANAANARWHRSWHPMAAIADHRPMEEIDRVFAELEVYGAARDRTEYCAACARLSQMTRAFAEQGGLNWWSLL